MQGCDHQWQGKQLVDRHTACGKDKVLYTTSLSEDSLRSSVARESGVTPTEALLCSGVTFTETVLCSETYM
jgi:hypothetical protein